MTTPIIPELGECKCSLAIRLTGDGCRYCQPQTYIEMMIDQVDEMDNDLDAAEDKNAQLIAVIRKMAQVIYNYQASLQNFSNDGGPNFWVGFEAAEKNLNEILAEAAEFLKEKK